MAERPAQQPQITISLGRARWLITTIVEIAVAVLVVTTWALFDPSSFWKLIAVAWGLALVVVSYRQAVKWGYEIVICGNNVRVRSLLRSWEFPLSAVVDVSGPLSGRYGLLTDSLRSTLDGLLGRLQGRSWTLDYQAGSERRKVRVMTRMDLRATPLAQACPEEPRLGRHNRGVDLTALAPIIHGAA